MALLNGVGQVASIAQLAGVDAYGLISMIVEAAQTVKRNRETCQLLARCARMIGDLLQQLERTQLMQHMETRNPVEQLEETPRHAYFLITSCRGSSYLHNCCMGGKQADQLREVQNEITFYLQLFPIVSFVDNTRSNQRLSRQLNSEIKVVILPQNPRKNEQTGKLTNGLDVAVKRLDTSSFQGHREFRTEIESIPNLQHKNIISLLGDIKASNILLDNEMNAKITDFGLALMLSPNTTAEVVVMGTYGYADPEYVATGNITEKADVYGFGIVLIEIISGRLLRSIKMKPEGTPGLPLDYAHKYQKKLHKLVDPLLRVTECERAQIMECARVALLCIHHLAKHRPTMSEVVTMLGSIM
ncbi:hypothetical protein U9M48_001218 [Paspalum notatum var. saurae]|uniref:Protein kinase domain-containing protein n=1 Tax=Paspalum notatum var. saurae TaxID=547442 RepID=A0AAQ3SCT4_PASNO